MIKYLIITHIPKDEDILREILDIIEDYTWSDEGVENWMNTDTNTIYYVAKYDSYFAGTGDTLSVTTKHISKPYWNVIGRVLI